MKNLKFFTGILLSCFSTYSFAQSGITTDVSAPYNDIEYLIQDVLSDGSALISNVTYTYGDPQQVGYFSDANTANPIFGYSDGIFMSTSQGAPLENNVFGATPGPSPSTIQDPDLDASLQLLFGSNYVAPTGGTGGHDQNNLIVIEFDIVANLDYFEFFYSFASREYSGFTCSNSYNDVFGFYVSGPNPNDPANPYIGENIALIPTDLTQTSFTTTPVSINSLNQGFATGNGQPATCATANPNWLTDNIFFNQNFGATTPVDFYYTGYTRPLKAYVPAQCNETYHMKLAICDTWDNGLGSAVLLQKGSLRSPVDVTVEHAPNVYPDTNGWFYEGCGTASITFKRPSVPDFAPGTGDLQVDFTLLGQAIYGVDYSFLNSTVSDHIIIPNWDNEFTLEINPINDGLAEGTESLIVQIPHLLGESCDADHVEIELTIADYPELIIELVDEVEIHCPGDEVTFEVFVNGGIPINATDPYNVHWSQIGYAYQQTVYPNETTTYYVEIADLCPQYNYMDSIIINVAEWPEMVIDKLEDQYICTDVAAQYDFLNNKVHGGDGVFTYSWVNVNTGEEVSTDENPLLFAGEYEITIRDGCENFASSTVEIHLYELPDLDILANEQDGELIMEFSINEFPINSNYTFMLIDYTWDFGDGSPLVVNKGPLTHEYAEFGFYTVTLTLTNERGCEKVFTKVIEVSPLMSVPTIFTPNGDGINEGFNAVSSRHYSSFEMHIFDRWGQELFISDDINDKWYGLNKEGTLCGEGLYVYKIKVKYPNYPDTKEHEGVFHLTR